MEIGKYAEQLWFAVTTVGKIPMILGHTWLNKYNADIDWNSGKVTLNWCPDEYTRLCYTRFAKLLYHAKAQNTWLHVVQAFNEKLQAELKGDQMDFEEVQKLVPAEYWDT